MADEASSHGPAPIAGAGPAFPIQARLRRERGRRIVIDERLGKTTITREMPLARFAGVMMAEGALPDLYDIALVRDDGFAVRLSSASEADSIAIWRTEARRFEQPMVIWSEGVGLVTIEAAQPLSGAKPFARRRGRAALLRRRPRFLTRRKTSRLPLAPVVYGAAG